MAAAPAAVLRTAFGVRFGFLPTRARFRGNDVEARDNLCNNPHICRLIATLPQESQ